ncbi:MAG: 4-phosphoerythronate dehydrogenase [Muribaculaceae bacterium]|nr:4-phosphoerythronate dehydrogenase [Muribaculaceae bacterium]
MKIIVENRIPYIEGVLEPYGTVEYLPAEAITADAVRDADALLTRTRTRCDAKLLAGSTVKFVGTATIGTDHIDKDFCREAGIEVANAPGCNAPAVAQYVMGALTALKGADGLRGRTLGVVGVGHVGRIVADWGKKLGMNVLECDPPRHRDEGGRHWVTLDEIAERADFITFHTPLTRGGTDRTWHLADGKFFDQLGRQPVIVNAARGAVVDTEALLAAREAGLTGELVIDCWEGEPDVNRRLLDVADVATPHIAGYSREGKVRATAMVVDALAEKFGLPMRYRLDSAPFAVAEGAAENVTAKGIAESYDPRADRLPLSDVYVPEAFEAMRNNYALRPEYRGE